MAAGTSAVLALDVGDKRVGVAVASLVARLPRPLATLDAEAEDFFDRLRQLAESEGAGALVVGYPRGLEGQSTDQTASVEAFISQLKEQTSLPVHWQDEALTSRRAEAELEARGKAYSRGDVDALAATYILEDWLADNPEAA